jgi:glycosyltransferase involved in cell wall biosynthesis
LGWQRVADGALGHRQKPFLNTNEHDIAIFQDSRAVTLPPRTQKIIRYHDGIPVLAGDFMHDQVPAELHARGVAACERDSLYVCNSTSARNDLEKLSARAADRAEVIPYFVPEMRRPGFKADLRKLAAVRISQSTLGTKTATEVINKWFGENPGETPACIMTLATIEPRKNTRGLIRAWQQLRDRFKHDVKLMMVGTPGWDFEPILREMRLYVEMGYLLHLERLSQNELPLVYSGARCFAYLSFVEGFGIPPIEAMQCDCPVLVSDVPAHRYAAGDGAIYCDPYDDDDIAARLNDILVTCQNGTINNLLQRGRDNAAKYTIDKVLPLWESLFSRLATKPTG